MTNAEAKALYSQRKKRMFLTAWLTLIGTFLAILLLVVLITFLCTKQLIAALVCGATLILIALGFLLLRSRFPALKPLSCYQFQVQNPDRFVFRVDACAGAQPLDSGAFSTFQRGSIQIRYLRQTCSGSVSSLGADRKHLYRMIRQSGCWTDTVPVHNRMVQIAFVVYDQEFPAKVKNVQAHAGQLLSRGLPLINAAYTQRDGMLYLPAISDVRDLIEVQKYCSVMDFFLALIDE